MQKSYTYLKSSDIICPQCSCIYTVRALVKYESCENAIWHSRFIPLESQEWWTTFSNSRRWYITWRCRREGRKMHLESRCRPQINSLVQDCRISSVLAMEILQSCTKPSISSATTHICMCYVKWNKNKLLLFLLYQLEWSKFPLLKSYQFKWFMN